MELDHVFCLVEDPREAAERLEGAGWALDAGQAHRGQGTRNRRLPWPGQFLELLWVTDEAEARSNPLRLDRRAGWRTTGASPFGIALRGELDPLQREDYWLYDALGPRIWIHRDDQEHPERPLVFVLEGDPVERRKERAAMAKAVAHRRGGVLEELRLSGPSPPSLPACGGPRIRLAEGPHRLEPVVGTGDVAVVEEHLALRGRGS